MFVHSWRWFGPRDRIKPEQIVQTGASGIVTSLHEFPVGEAWSGTGIRERNRLIRKAGLVWSAVESVPVHEDIKKRTGKYREYTENFKKTIINLGKEGVKHTAFLEKLDLIAEFFGSLNTPSGEPDFVRFKEDEVTWFLSDIQNPYKSPEE